VNTDGPGPAEQRRRADRPPALYDRRWWARGRLLLGLALSRALRPPLGGNCYSGFQDRPDRERHTNVRVIAITGQETPLPTICDFLTHGDGVPEYCAAEPFLQHYTTFRDSSPYFDGDAHRVATCCWVAPMFQPAGTALPTATIAFDALTRSARPSNLITYDRPRRSHRRFHIHPAEPCIRPGSTRWATRDRHGFVRELLRRGSGLPRTRTAYTASLLVWRGPAGLCR